MTKQIFMDRKTLTVWGANIGMVLLLAAGVMPLLRMGDTPWWRWLYTAGADRKSTRLNSSHWS